MNFFRPAYLGTIIGTLSLAAQLAVAQSALVVPTTSNLTLKSSKEAASRPGGIQLAQKAASTPDELRVLLKTLYPQNPEPAHIGTSPVDGLFEVLLGDRIAYVDKTGQFIIFNGAMIDYKNQVNITEARMAELSRIDPSTLDLRDAMKTVKGNGKRTLYVFSDPDCPFCKQLERNDLKGVDDVTIYTFFYPIESLHPQAKAKAIAIWCAGDKQAAWDAALQADQAPAAASCDNPVERNMALGQRLRVTGTPAIFGADGQAQFGSRGPVALNEFLQKTTVAAKPN
jgi:thiol:disulfide interchange protein DsbC